MSIIAIVLLTLVAASRDPQRAVQPSPDSGALLEIRSYNLKPGERDRFQERFVHESLPLLVRQKIDVVAYGPSLLDRDSWFLMRAFASFDARSREEDAFYASDAWRNGPRTAVLAAIESYTTVIIRVDQPTLDGLRHSMTTPGSQGDVEALARLNAEYIKAVTTSNVAFFHDILADDFLCSLPDGSLIDRAQFLAQTAKPYVPSNLEAHDVNIRLLGDVAIIHARTTFQGPGGAGGSGRYTDIWARRNGRWLVVAAHVTRT